MSVYPIPHDEHVHQREYFLNRDLSAIKPLTVERAVQWLSYPTWKRHEAILIFDGHDPESRRFYEEDGALFSLAQLLNTVFPHESEQSSEFYLDWMAKRRIELPEALNEALKIVKNPDLKSVSSSTQVLASEQQQANLVSEPQVKNGIQKVWTPEFFELVFAYRANHTEDETANHFGKSGALIRRKLREFKERKASQKTNPFLGLVKK